MEPQYFWKLDPDPHLEKSWIRIRILEKSWIRIRIRIEVKSWIRIRIPIPISITVMRIRNPGPNKFHRNFD
jgi:hypothetical protein